MTQKVLLIEDDQRIAEPVIYGFRKAGFSVVHAASGEQGLQLVRQEHFDAILLDVMLPGIDGFEVCRLLRKFSSVPILMVTARGQEMERVMGLDVGADDYIVKPFSFQELLARVRALLRRVALDQQALPDEEILQIGPIQLNRFSREVTRNGARVELSRREFDLLAVLMSHAGKALSRQELLDQVWGESWFGTHRTLDVHIRWLREKLEENPSEPRYIETIYGYGYRFNQDSAE